MSPSARSIKVSTGPFIRATEHGTSRKSGWETQFAKVSALHGTGLDDLLDAVLLQSGLEHTASTVPILASLRLILTRDGPVLTSWL